MTPVELKVQVEGAMERGVLTDRAIRRARETGELRVEPFDDALVRPAALSLRLGHEAFTLVTTGPVDVADRSTHPELVAKEPDAPYGGLLRAGRRQ